MNNHSPRRCAALVIDAAGQAQLDAVPDVVVIHERDGNVLFANSAARVRWPCLVGASLLPLLVIEDRAPCAEAWRALRVERTLEADLHLIEGDSPMIVHTAVHPVDPDVLVSSLRPVRVPVAAPTPSAALGFVADVSHELRTPLSAIVGLTHLLEAEALTPRARDQVAKLADVATSMLGLVGEVLDFAKIDAGKMTLERVEFDPAEIFASLHATFDERAAERHDALLIDCDPGIPSRLVGDPLRLQQVLTNLVGNALKFTEHGVVRLRCHRRGADASGVRVAFEVEDTGIGIEPDRLDALFGRFEQAEASTSRRFGGSGLGLNIAAQLVGLMGGSIDVQSTPGVGSVFHFEVEFAVPEHPPRMPHAPAVDTLAGVRVLVAEDNAIQQFVVSELLRSVGADVGIAADGAEAMRRVVDEPWHVVLMDVEMPGVDGLEVTRWLRQQAAFAHLPIIAMTAHVSADRWQHALGAGMNDVVVKPVDPQRLREVVGHWRTTTLKSRVE